MPNPSFRSFQRTPVLFLTIETHGLLPWLANDDAHACLRDAWLQVGRASGWFVGQYLLLPAQARLFATPAMRCWPLADWVNRWQGLTQRRIAACAQWTGEIWQPEFSHRFLNSADDYIAKAGQLQEAPEREGLVGQDSPWRFRGMIWEICEWERVGTRGPD